MEAPLDELKRTADKIIEKLPALEMPDGTCLPRLLTRLDMGYMINGEFKPFVNEVEFVPSLYVENVKDEFVDRFIVQLGRQMVNITKTYMRARMASSKSLAHSSKTGRVPTDPNGTPNKKKRRRDSALPFKVQCLAKMDKMAKLENTAVDVTPLKKRKQATDPIVTKALKFAKIESHCKKGSPTEAQSSITASKATKVAPVETPCRRRSSYKLVAPAATALSAEALGA